MKIILLNRQGHSPITDLTQVWHCFQMLTYGLSISFNKIEGIEVSQENFYKYIISKKTDFSSFPECDVVIQLSISKDFTEELYNQIKKKCKLFVSFKENTALYCDYSFFLGHGTETEKAMRVSTPYTPEFYQNIEKESKSILLDHPYNKFWKKLPQRDWSKKIWKWIESLKEEYKIYTLLKQTRDEDGDWKEEALKILPKYIIPLYDDKSTDNQSWNFKEYLEKTNKFEQFIVTVHGSYNYSVVDMIARGIRVLSPKGFVYNKTIETFRDEKELIKLLKMPLDKTLLKNQLDKCISLDGVAKIMLNYFRKRLNE
jgi:hypothetical protein